MENATLRVPGKLKHTDGSSDEELAREARAFCEAHPGVRFIADVLRALHAPVDPLRTAPTFHTWFSPRQVLEAMAQRPDLRVKLLRAITGGPPALLRRLGPADLATQIDVLVLEDLPPGERGVRLEEDRALSVAALYLKYLEPSDVASYLPAVHIWSYESNDSWWTRDASPATRALMAAEIKSIRRHAIVSDGAILDIVGDETLERELPTSVRTRLRAAARRAGREGRVFSDADTFASAADGPRDLVDVMVEHVALPTLRRVVDRAAELLGIADTGAAAKAPAAAGALPTRATGPSDTSSVSIPVSKPAPVATLNKAASPLPARAATPLSRADKAPAPAVAVAAAIAGTPQRSVTPAPVPVDFEHDVDALDQILSEESTSERSETSGG